MFIPTAGTASCTLHTVPLSVRTSLGLRSVSPNKVEVRNKRKLSQNPLSRDKSSQAMKNCIYGSSEVLTMSDIAEQVNKHLLRMIELILSCSWGAN